MADGLTDAFHKFHMGMCAENTATEHKITREEQDAYAIRSYANAAAAHKAGRFEKEIAPVTISTKKGDIIVKDDEEIYKVDPKKIPGLRSAFKKDG